ncbi:hypothetical protein FRB98_006123 [Tulasnella sp. 332]|nr:hypothetical protein FRB98_006123 [Tulasnella sp. 332]
MVFSRISSCVIIGYALVIASVSCLPNWPSSDIKLRHVEHVRHNFSAPTRDHHLNKRTHKGKHCASQTSAAEAVATALGDAVKLSAVQPTVSNATTSNPIGDKCSDTVKAGLSWTDNSLTTQDQFLSGACWCYNWGPGWCSKAQNIDNVPMLWGTQSSKISAWKSATNGKSYDNILAFNEPNIDSQSNISSTDAAAAYKKYFEPVNAGAKGSPAVTSGSSGVNWLQDFLTACSGCQVDFLVIHVYCVTSTDAINFIQQFLTTFPTYDFWITEIGCQDFSGKGETCSQEMANAMLSGVKTFVMGEKRIKRWAWYEPSEEINIDPSNRLMDTNGDITPFGKLFLAS